MPNWCSNDVTIRHKDLEKIEALAQAYKDGRLFDHIKPMPKDLLEKGEDWYNWRVHNWSTKWDVSPECDIYETTDETGTDLQLSFDTAWSPPIGVYEELCRQGYEVRAYYIEEGIGFVGRCFGDADGFTDIECDLDGDGEIEDDVAEYYRNAIDERNEWLSQQGDD